MLGAIDQGDLAARCSSAVAAGDAAGAVAIAERDAGAQPVLRYRARRPGEPAAARRARAGGARCAGGSAERARERERSPRGSIRSRCSSTTRSRCRAGEDLPLAPDEHAGFVMTVLRMLAFRPEGGAAALPVAAKAPTAAAKAGAAEAPARRSAPPAASAGRAARRSRRLARARAQLQVTGAARELARNAELRGRDGASSSWSCRKRKAYLAERSLRRQAEGGARAAPRRRRSRVNVSRRRRLAARAAAALEAGEREAQARRSGQGGAGRRLRAGPRQPVRRQGRRLHHPPAGRQMRRHEGQHRAADEAGAADAGEHAPHAGEPRHARSRGPVGRRHGEGADDLQVRGQARDASIPSLVGDDREMLEDLVVAAFNDAVAQGRGHDRREDERHDRRASACRRASSCRSEAARQTRSVPTAKGLERLVAGAARAAGRRARRRRSAWPTTCCSTTARARERLARCADRRAGQRAALRAVQQLHRGGALRAVPLAAPRRLAALRGRDAGRPVDGRADAELLRACISC